jgi:hypothetical protein
VVRRSRLIEWRGGGIDVFLIATSIEAARDVVDDALDFAGDPRLVRTVLSHHSGVAVRWAQRPRIPNTG